MESARLLHSWPDRLARGALLLQAAGNMIKRGACLQVDEGAVQLLLAMLRGELLICS
jgi:hypothetical protein